MLWTYWWSYIIVVPGIIFSVIAQIMVKNTYSYYSRVPSKLGLTAEALSEKLLRANDCAVRVVSVKGELTDNYNPSTKVLSLSQSTYGKTSVAALGVAAHETGHAVQDAKRYLPLRFRAILVPVVNFGSRLAVPLVVVGVLLELFIQNPVFGDWFITLGIISYSLATIFALVTLPVEFNASHRAIRMLKDSGTMDKSELAGAKKVLTAAAMTYVASMLVSLLYLLRFILIVSRFRRKD